MQPHEEDWDLEPANAHPQAQALLTEAFYWDCTDEDSPLGNDTGADILSAYSEALAMGVPLDAVRFLIALLSGWEMLLDDLKVTNEDKVRKLFEKDPDSVSTTDEALIGMAFAQYVIHGEVGVRVRDLALTAIKREQVDVLVNDWPSPAERKERLSNFAEKLSQMKTEA